MLESLGDDSKSERLHSSDGFFSILAVRRLRQRVATLGFELVNRETGELLAPAAS